MVIGKGLSSVVIVVVAVDVVVDITSGQEEGGSKPILMSNI